MKVLMILLSSLLLGTSTGNAQAQMDHSHMPLEVPEDVQVPALDLRLRSDVMSGYNLHLETRHFVLEPPPAQMNMRQMMSASRDPRSGVLSGHAHLYVNGRKIQRLYAADVHLPASLFKTGVNQITVTLNNHGHMDLVHQGRQILASLFVDPAATPAIVHRFAAQPPGD